jgi:transmembrane sensor
MDNKPNKIIVNQAAQWYARLHAPDCSSAEHQKFKAWLAGGYDREQAYKSVVDAAGLVSKQLSSDPRMQALLSNALQEPPCKTPAAQLLSFLNASINYYRYAAAMLVFVGVAIFFTFGRDQALDVSPTEYYVNNELNKQRIELTDGSVVYLDVGAKLSVAMSSKERHLELERGRAFFDVAHDKARPFSVNKAGTRVVALGTRFQVDVAPDNQTVNVTLAEGSVAVTNSLQADSWREMLVPGQQILIDNVLHQRQIQKVNVDDVTSWSTGFLVFDGTPLKKALEEVNRYVKVKVVLGDNSLAEIPISGNFIAGGDTSDFVETLAAVLPLRSARTGANEIVLFEKYDIQKP